MGITFVDDTNLGRIRNMLDDSMLVSGAKKILTSLRDGPNLTRRNLMINVRSVHQQEKEKKRTLLRELWLKGSR